MFALSRSLHGWHPKHHARLFWESEPLQMKSRLRISIALGVPLLSIGVISVIRFGPVLFSERYLPHRFCYLAQPWLIWTNAPADMAIFLSYVVLFESLFLLAWLVRSQLRPYLWIFLAFGLFILTCGLTHFMEVVTIWWPLYPLSTSVKILCALASVPTAIVFQRKVPLLSKEIKQYLQEIHTGREALVASERLAAVGRLSASISHEINNPLESVMNLMYLIGTHPGLPADLQPSVTLAEAELKRVARIANHTLTYYRESAQPERVNLNQIAEDVLTLERAHINSARVTVTTKFFGQDAIITAHPGEMRQILINLIENSLAALPPGGRLHISIRRSPQLASRQPGFVVRVADSGHGIPRSVIPKLFTPFFTTKGPNGTGLGLWIIRQIIEKQGGALRIRSRDGVGTIVSIWLPTLANPGGGQTMLAKSHLQVLTGSGGAAI
jgi:signal transduction histidine kinase